jgi:pyridoxal phosphate enzyme (YggS family)
MQTIAEGLKSARKQISLYCENSGRPKNSVQLLAASKAQSVDQILIAYQNGQRLFGENYVQGGIKKIQQLQHYRDIEWHFIGPIQSNKTRLIAEHFDWCQSLDREKIARRLNQQRSIHADPLHVCIQVNIDGEASKSGIMPENVMPLATDINDMDRLSLRGLMCIPSPQASLAEYQRMRDLFDSVQQYFPTVDTLSMGMSTDTQIAIRTGSTMVRLGTAIFGARSPKPSDKYENR